MAFFSPLRPLLKGWLLSLLGWGLVGFAMATHGVTTRGDAWSEHLEPSLRSWLPWALLTPLLFRLTSHFPFDRERWKRSAPVHLAACIAVLFTVHSLRPPMRLKGPHLGPPPKWKADGGPAFHPDGDHFPPNGSPPGGPHRDFGAAASHGPEDDSGIPGENGPGALPRLHDRLVMRGPGVIRPPGGRGMFDFFFLISFELPIYLMIVTGAHAAFFFRRDQERAASLARARLSALRMQLQPHFLFNTLNTIAGLVHDEPDRADAMLTALGDLLRLSLESSEAQELPLAREIDFVERYLQLMHARFEERLRFDIRAEADVQAALVPPMLLQPLVENAVEHGLRPKPDGGLVTVCASRAGDALRLSVSDNGVGAAAPPAREGIGLGNTRARLKELYGGRAALALRNGDGFTVEITLPFRTASSPSE